MSFALNETFRQERWGGTKQSNLPNALLKKKITAIKDQYELFLGQLENIVQEGMLEKDHRVIERLTKSRNLMTYYTNKLPLDQITQELFKSVSREYEQNKNSFKVLVQSYSNVTPSIA